MNSPTRKPAEDGGAREPMTRINYQPMLSINNTKPVQLAKADELAALLRGAVPDIAREILLNLPHAMRTAEESQFLSDCVAGKRNVTPRVMARLVDLQTRGDAHIHYLLSTTIETIEARAAGKIICAFEASEFEQETNGPLNMAQLLAAREKTPVRWGQVRDTAKHQLVATKNLMVAADLLARKVS